jgi:hypothetical protein
MCVLSGARLFNHRFTAAIWITDAGRPALEGMSERIAASMRSSMKRLPGYDEQRRRWWPCISAATREGHVARSCLSVTLRAKALPAC